MLAVLLAGAGLAVALSMSLAVERERGQAHEELTALRHQRLAATARPQPSLATPTTAIPELPEFDSTEVVRAFTSIVADAGLPLEEVSYALEDVREQPYLRYRISLSVKSTYPQTRQAVAALASAMPHVALDGIRCSRESTAVAALGCELSFSAFFRKPHG
ncbi:hypothetical protein [Pseudoduganella armeniaca]|uniref:Type 4a pilus biogenesis protein PilO n=1 Tax=Pseudoduganella armeniaca TaxID=2072590 RepID=A0A2R4C6L1_9BURK|nr:hypothetical protein [Pseudoduganella armeniaca]AVR95249.1 hypothetical protein C9I28_05560 [Pseudoduganella armeniaca]